MERGALVGLDYSSISALDVEEGDRIRPSHIQYMRNAINDMCERYHRSHDEFYELNTLLDDAGVGGPRWDGKTSFTNKPERLYGVGNGTYHILLPASIKVAVEHVNELYAALLLLTKPRMRAYFNISSRRRGYGSERGSDSFDQLYDTAYGEAVPGSIVENYGLINYRLEAWTNEEEEDERRVVVGVSMSNMLLGLYYEPEWALLTNPIVWSSGTVEVLFTRSTAVTGIYKGSLVENWKMCSEEGTTYASPVLAGGSGWPTVDSGTGLDGAKVLNVASILPTTTNYRIVASMELDDYSQHDPGEWPPAPDSGGLWWGWLSSAGLTFDPSNPLQAEVDPSTFTFS